MLTVLRLCMNLPTNYPRVESRGEEVATAGRGGGDLRVT